MYFNKAQAFMCTSQVRHLAFRRPPEQPSLIGRFIENVKQGLGGNKEMQVSTDDVGDIYEQ